MRNIGNQRRASTHNCRFLFGNLRVRLEITSNLVAMTNNGICTVLTKLSLQPKRYNNNEHRITKGRRIGTSAF